MQLSKRNSLAVFLILCLNIIFAQQYPSKNYSTLDGLPSNDIKALFKDSRGILWIGTQNGVSTIINGKIKNFTQEDGLAYNNCWAIVEDSNHNIWLGSYGGGITKFDGKKFTIINSKHGLINDYIRKLFSHKGKIYIGTIHGVSAIDINTGKIKNYIGIGLEDRFQVMSFLEYKDEVYCITYVDGVWKLKNDVLNQLYAYNDDYGRIATYLNNETLYCTDGNPFENKALQKTSIKGFLDNKIINRFGETYLWDFQKDRRGIIFGAGYGVDYPTGGIFQVNEGKLLDVSKKFGVDSHDIWCLYYDPKCDMLYVGSLDKGVYVVNLSGDITYYSINKQIPIIDIEQFNGRTALLYEDELILKNQPKNAEQSFTKQEFINFANQYIIKHGLQGEVKLTYPDNTVEGLGFKSIVVYQNLLWVGTNKGMYTIDTTGVFKTFIPIKNNNLFAFAVRGEMLSPLPYSGMEVFYNSDYYNPKVFDKIAANTPVDVSTIINLNTKTYLLSKSKGLFSYDNGSFKSYLGNNIWEEKELVKGAKSTNNQMIIANSIGDVFTIDDSNGFKIINKISHKDIIGNTISFLEAYKKYILIGTEKGINIYNNGQLQLIDDEQGLINKIFTSSKIIGDKLLIGSYSGYYELDLTKILNRNPVLTSMEITKLEVNYEPWGQDNFKWLKYSERSISLPYDKNTLTLNFAPHNHPYPNKLRYRYNVKGLGNAQWSEWSSDGTILLPYLPDGDFTIKLECKDLYTGKIQSYQLLNIIITPPFWKTWWFIISGLLCTIVSGFYIYKWRVRVIQKDEKAKGEIQKRLAETKLEALQSQMNPHFIFNAMNSIQNFIIDNDVDKALMFMGEFSKLVRQTLDNSSKLKITLETELEYLKSYITLENMRFGNRVNVDISVDEDIEPYDIELPPMLVQPFVENAFVHAFDANSINPTLKVSFDLSDNLLFINVTDNGKGISSENNNRLFKSKGMTLAKERIVLFQSGSEPVEVISAVNTGTTIIIKLPI